jgi:IMP dehydrogenase
MGKILKDTYVTFDDVLIRPSRSHIEPREASLRAVLVKDIDSPTPFLSAAMDRVTDDTFAIAIFKAGGMGVIHRNCLSDEQSKMVKKVKDAGAKVGAACGPFDIDRAKELAAAGVDFLVIDCAHGHNAKVIKSARKIKSLIKLPLVVGNIATKEAVRDLYKIADAVKVGVGPGSICTTRIVSGVGVPQLSAILEVAAEAHKLGMLVIADGGMRGSGDIAKALAAGADSVMLGNVFAGAKEAPGKVIVRDGKRYKEYRGMGSRAVLEEKKSSDRYLVAGRKAVPEGVEGFIECKGSVAEIVDELSSGIQVAMGYVGAKDISEFQQKAAFIRITGAGQNESRPHSLAFATKKHITVHSNFKRRW